MRQQWSNPPRGTRNARRQGGLPSILLRHGSSWGLVLGSVLAVLYPASVAGANEASAGGGERGEVTLRASVHQHGITWSFAAPSRVGRFVNGDWYVVGPTEVVAIQPKPLWGEAVSPLIDRDSVRETKYPGKQARHGSVINPPAKSRMGGFDSRIPSGRYDPGLFAHLPIRMNPGDSLVSTISRPNEEITRFGGQHVDPLKVAAVLTCVEKPQPADAFRPSFCDPKNSGIHLARNLRRDRLLKLRRTSSAPNNLDTYVKAVQKPWLDVVEFGFAAPVENLPHYGQEMAQVVGEASLLLLMDYPSGQKEALLVNLVQVGIDLWGTARAGMTWPAHGGLNSGRKWPIIFAGLMLGDAAMQSPTNNLPDLHFGEDDQTALCPYEYDGITYSQGWTGAKAIFTGHSLAGTGGGRGEWARGWGPVDLFPPSRWPKRERGDLPSSESYRRANTSGAWVSQALAARLLHAEPVWKHDAFFAYVDRWMTEDDTPFLSAIKEAGFGDLTRIPPRTFQRQGHIWGPKFVREMWEAYRDRLPPSDSGRRNVPAAETWK